MSSFSWSWINCFSALAFLSLARVLSSLRLDAPCPVSPGSSVYHFRLFQTQCSFSNGFKCEGTHSGRLEPRAGHTRVETGRRLGTCFLVQVLSKQLVAHSVQLSFVTLCAQNRNLKENKRTTEGLNIRKATPVLIFYILEFEISPVCEKEIKFLELGRSGVSSVSVMVNTSLHFQLLAVIANHWCHDEHTLSAELLRIGSVMDYGL